MSYVSDRQKALEQQQQQGESAFLNSDERKNLQRILSFPEEFPRKFGSWIADYIAVNGLEIPISQIRGYSKFRPVVALNGQAVDINDENVYTSKSGGPSITIGAGTWFLQYGFQFAANDGTSPGYLYVSPSVNSVTPVDGDALRSKFMLGSADATSSEEKTQGSSVFFKILTVEEAENTIELKYKVTDGNFLVENVYIIATKQSN